MKSDSTLPSLLVVGGTKTGKTHYGGQLLRRLDAKKHRLRMAVAASDRTPFQEVLDKLALGRSAPHTPTSIYRESVWNIWVDGSGDRSQLIWPDYGGEQIEDIVRKRQISEPWIQRVREAGGWLFFVRPRLINMPEDILNRPRTKDRMQSVPEEAQMGGNSAKESTNVGSEQQARQETSSQNPALRTQASLIELLQALLFVKQVGRNAQLSHPPLVVVLSCWDEIANVKVNGHWLDPTRFLAEYLPFLGQFIASTWKQDRFRVIGLSALGKPLKEDVDDDAFMDDGPERQGRCVIDGGAQDDDLTIPVLTLTELMRDEG
ncbi:MAG: hypothetical protein ACLQU1_08565 [Bryobacteraceae bacterium]